jgi:hypothetical protein
MTWSIGCQKSRISISASVCYVGVLCCINTTFIKLAEAKAELAYDSAESAAMNIDPLPLFAAHLPEVSIHKNEVFG